MTKTNAQAATKTRAAKAIKAVTSTDHTTTEITGVPTEAQKAKARANPRKPKAGQSFPNQQEIAAPSDVIVEVKPVTSGGDYMAVSTGSGKNGQTFMCPKSLFVGRVATAAAIGKSFKDAEALFRAAKLASGGKLANGVDGRNSPHSAKAVSDKGRSVAANNKADAATQKAPAPKAPKAAKAAPAKAVTGNRPYKWTGENKAREGTWRHAMLDCLSKNKDKDGASACLKKNREFGASHVIDFRWCAAQGYIQWAD